MRTMRVHPRQRGTRLLPLLLLLHATAGAAETVPPPPLRGGEAQREAALATTTASPMALFTEAAGGVAKKMWGIVASKARHPFFVVFVATPLCYNSPTH